MELTIYIDRLKEGQVEKFKGTYPSDFLGEDPKFSGGVQLEGEAYIANDHLILKLKAEATALFPCSVCNELTTVPLLVKDFYHVAPLEELPSVFHFSSLLREDILLELPLFFECGGNCPEREALKTFLKQQEEGAKHSQANVHYPFSEL